MFFIVIRRCFDFNLYPNHVDLKAEILKQQLNLWEFLTTVISKVWFFILLIELRERSDRYLKVLKDKDSLSKEFQDTQMHKLLSTLSTGNFGIPAYASKGEIVILRIMQEDEIYKTFIDTNKPWIKELHKLLKYGNYQLRYQYPYGVKIHSYPTEVALSFSSPQFLDDRLGYWFGKTGLEHPLSKFEE